MPFSKAVAQFTEINSEQATEKIQSADKFILFVGRSSCPFCQRFAPKLSRVASDNNLEVYFLNSENTSDIAGIKVLRTRHNIPTVPGLLVAKNGDVKVVCDSSLSEEAILAFIN